MIEWFWNNQIEAFALLFAQYVLIFEFQHWIRDHKLTKPVYLVFIVQDWIVNLVIMSIWFLDPPAKVTEVVTTRMQRYKAHGGYSPKGIQWLLMERVRYRFALILCKALNVWDKGHC